MVFKGRSDFVKRDDRRVGNIKDSVRIANVDTASGTETFKPLKDERGRVARSRGDGDLVSRETGNTHVYGNFITRAPSTHYPACACKADRGGVALTEQKVRNAPRRVSARSNLAAISIEDPHCGVRAVRSASNNDELVETDAIFG